MTIKANIGIPVIAIGVTDTTILQPALPLNRRAVTSFVIHNEDNTATVTVTLYESPNTTSASGSELAVYVVGPNASVDVTEFIQSFPVGRNIIAVADVAGGNARLTVTDYTDPS